MAEERAKYGYCPKCGEPFERPYTHCPFCNAVNPHLEQDLEKKRQNSDELLKKQLRIAAPEKNPGGVFRDRPVVNR